MSSGRALFSLLLATSAFACSRSELGLLEPSERPDAGETTDAGETPDAGETSDAGESPDAREPPDASVPPPVNFSACTFSPSAPSTTPVLVAIAGRTLVGLTPQGTLVPLFQLGVASDNPANTAIVSRGHLVAAVVAQTTGTDSSATTQIEIVVVHLDGTVVAQVSASIPGGGSGASVAAIGNAAGTFAFSVTVSEDSPAGFQNVEETWLTLADGEAFGPVDGVSIQPLLGAGFSANPSTFTVEPDTEGRVLAWSQSAMLPVWLDVRTGAQTPSVLLAETNASPSAVSASAWGAELFGLTSSFDLATETADGVTLLPHAPIATDFFGFWDFTATGVAMFALPPHSGYLSTSNNIELVTAGTLADRTVSIAFPSALSPAYPGSFLSPVDISTSPAGFGVDSAGRVTMFLTDGETASFEATEDGQTWTPIGEPVPLNVASGIYVPLMAVEAGGTYLLSGPTGTFSIDPDGGTPAYQLVRPSAGIDVALAGGSGHLSHDGACVAVLASASELDVTNAATGVTTAIPIAPAIGQNASFLGTWIPGDDVILP